MLNICGEYKKLWDIKFNLEKSCCCTLGGNRPQYGNVELAFKPLQRCSQVKYLGCFIRCETCKIDPRSLICKFCGSFNNIMRMLGVERNGVVAVNLSK